MQKMDSQTQKPLIWLVPHYVASLKYFEKIRPYLEDKYRPIFLLNFGRKSYKDMVIYAKQYNIPFCSINPPTVNPYLCLIPLYRTIKEYKYYTEEITRIITKEHPQKIITTNDQGFYMGFLMKIANLANIETLVLQWALTYPGQRILPAVKTSTFRKFIYRIGKPLYVQIKKILLQFVLKQTDDWSKGTIGGGRAKKFGVINEQAKEFFVKHDIPSEKMQVVGFIDFHLSEKLMKDTNLDISKKNILAKDLEIDLTKKNVIFYSTPFNRKDIGILSDEDQYKMTEITVGTIREICPFDKFEIIFKPHPTENHLQYASLSKYNVKFTNPLGDNNKLIYLSDLYIAGVSTTNFIPLVMDKDAIFVNLAKLKQIESARSFFGIKKFVTEKTDLVNLLIDFKNGKLEKQYDSSDKIITCDSLNKILKWIN